MNRTLNKIFDFLCHIVGFSHFKYPDNIYGRILSFGVLIFHTSAVSVSIYIAEEKVSKEALKKIGDNYVQTVIFCVTILSSYLMFISAWLGRNLERKIHENLEKADEALKKYQTKKSSRKSSCKTFAQIASLIFLKLFPFFICIFLSSVELFLEKKNGLWRILIYPSLLVKFSFYKYAILVEKISKKFEKINSELLKLVEEDQKIYLPFARFAPITQNHKFISKISTETVKFIKVYEILHNTVKIFNKRFGVLILLMILSSFLSIVFCGFNFFINVETTKNKLVIIGE